MNIRLRSMARKWIPAEVLRLSRAWLRYGVVFSGEFDSWQEASVKGRGYDAPEILAKVAEATRAVKNGAAVFERDSVLFSEPHYPYPLIAGLLRAAARHGGRLSVVDFGGSLGSSYYQCRDFLRDLPEVRWCVVEQPQFVRKGREEFGDGVLSFADSIEEACAAVAPNVIVFSGVLQYLPDPWSVLRQADESGVHSIIIDRVSVIQGAHDVISVQKIPKRISASSYPIRLFTRDSLLNPLEKRYAVLAEFDAVDGILGGLLRPVAYRGYILELK